MTADAVGSDAADPGPPRVEAHLTWQVPDPAVLAEDLRRRLGVRAMAGAGPDGTLLVPLDVAVLELVPWRRETAGDEPQPGGRLVLEPVEAGWAPPGWSRVAGSRSAAASEAPSADVVMTLAGIGWATVDLDRAARELGPWLLDDPVASGAPGGTGTQGRVREDPHLGARTLVRATNGLPGEAIVLSEPTTEGRLAASLARHGEGPVALYLRPVPGLDAWVAAARARRVSVSARRDGPLGPQVLVLPVGVAPAMVGPHLIVVEGRSPSSRPAPDGNIRA